MFDPETIDVGLKYFIMYQLEGQRSPRYGVGVVMDVDFNNLTLSGRPEYGTTVIPVAAISHAQMVKPMTVNYMDARQPRRYQA